MSHTTALPPNSKQQAGKWSHLYLLLPQGNFPYPSSYILNGLGELPAYPVRVACESLGQHNMAGAELLRGLAGAVAVFYNYTGDLQCLDYTQVSAWHDTRVCRNLDFAPCGRDRWPWIWSGFDAAGAASRARCNKWRHCRKQQPVGAGR